MKQRENKVGLKSEITTKMMYFLVSYPKKDVH